MNSRQEARYIKRRMGNDLKKQILVHNGVLTEEEIQKKTVRGVLSTLQFG
jgi:integrase/recombinase XerD